MTEHSVHEPSVRERVLDAAVELFATNGYEGTSVNQVIERAGVAKGGFYHHFASKAELLSEVYGDLITRQLASLQQILATGDDPATTLRNVIEDLMVTTAASASRALVFFREMSKIGGEREAELRQARRRYHDLVMRLIRDGQASGAFARVATPETITFTIFGVINELPLWYQPGGRKRPEQWGAELADFVLAALGRGPDSERQTEKKRSDA